MNALPGRWYVHAYMHSHPGMPPETEATHFTAVMSRFAVLHGMTLEQFCDAYNSGALHVPDLDLYFAHDRSLREV